MKEYLQINDGIRTLEYGIPLVEANPKNLLILKNIFLSYYRLGAFNEATAVYKRIEALAKGNPEAMDREILLTHAAILLEQKKWDEAIAAYQEIKSIMKPPMDKIFYGMGIAYYQKQEYRTARSHFGRVFWVESDPAVRESAEKFIIAIINARSFGAFGLIRYGSDSNVYRWSTLADFPSEYGSKSGNFYQVQGNIFYRGFENEHGSFYFGFDILRTGYSDSKLKSANHY